MMRTELAAGALALCLALPGTCVAAAGVVAYSRLTQGYWQIWTYDVAAQEQRQITQSPFDKRDPAWSPDGSILFHTHNHELYRVMAGEQEAPILRRAWPASDAAWSPDQKRIALSGARTDVRDTSAIWLVADGGETRRVLTRGTGVRTHPTWSPDGKWLIYIRSFGAKGSAIERLASDGSREEEVLHDTFHNAYPAWSPDGRSLVYATNRSGDYDLIVRDLASGAEQSLAPAAGLDLRPCWSPDGRQIAFATFRRGRFEIWTVMADGTDAAPLFAVPEEASDPAWR